MVGGGISHTKQTGVLFARLHKHWHTAPCTQTSREAVIPHDTTHAASLTRSLRGLLIAQFFGAFNDNAWKLMVALLGIRQVAATMAPGADLEPAAQRYTALASLIFTLQLMP